MHERICTITRRFASGTVLYDCFSFLVRLCFRQNISMEIGLGRRPDSDAAKLGRIIPELKSECVRIF